MNAYRENQFHFFPWENPTLSDRVLFLLMHREPNFSFWHLYLEKHSRQNSLLSLRSQEEKRLLPGCSSHCPDRQVLMDPCYTAGFMEVLVVSLTSSEVSVKVLGGHVESHILKGLQLIQLHFHYLFRNSHSWVQIACKLEGEKDLVPACILRTSELCL